MADTDTKKTRRVFRNIAVMQITSYRLPPAGVVSILHRVSGALIFLLLPLVIWMFDASVTSEVSYARFTSAFQGAGGWFVKLVALALIWSWLLHTIAGVRYLWMDVSHAAVTREFGRWSALAALISSLLLTIWLGWKLYL